MATVERGGPSAATAIAFFVGLACVLVSGWMIVTLPSAGSVAAGWRHELICTLLAAFAINVATWSQGRPWPQPVALVATCALLLELAILPLPVPRLAALAVVTVLLAAAAAIAIPLEVRRVRGALLSLEAVVILGLADVVAITPVFAVLALAGTLR